MKKVLFAAAVAALVALPFSASAQMVPFPRGCSDVESVKQRLVDKYDEQSVLVSEIHDNENNVIGSYEIWMTADRSTGTVIRVAPHPMVAEITMACVLGGMWNIEPSGPELTPEKSAGGEDA